MSHQTPTQHATGPTLARGLGFWEATAINITQIVGAGVFATIPLILGVLPGAYALLAWLVAGVLILADSMVWGELGAAVAGIGRVVSLPARKLRPLALGPAHGLPLRLANPD